MLNMVMKLFFLFNGLSRIILFCFASIEKKIDFTMMDFLQTLVLGLINDGITVVYCAAPIALFSFLIPTKYQQTCIVKRIAYCLNYLLIMALCFLIVSEFTFWLEFSTRFNFIAVDYLIYTHEIIANIKESYPIFIIFPLLFIVGTTIYYIILPLIKTKLDHVTGFDIRLRHFVGLTLAAILNFSTYDPKITDIKNNNYLSEISKNGIYTLFSAYWENVIDYPTFYQTNDIQTSLNRLFDYIKEGNKSLNPQLLERYIQANGPKNDYNIFLIPIESLSAEFLTTKNGTDPITPVINELIKHSAYFNNFYATGTRTIRGLEAITLSVPPTPGQSIIRRENNENLFSIASILTKENYDIKFIYGGYGYFDNMNYFFSNNSFVSLDRNNFPEKEISFSNAWGISDEDLYKQALKQADDSYSQNKKFFSLIMTTSNHRPYTYPDGKIKIPSGSNRNGGVTYADYALGEFIKTAQTKPWFDNTIFIITADHCAGSAGKTALPPEKYQIPLLIYAPKIMKPQLIDKLSSQIDIAPTILGLLNISYQSKFFGHDIFNSSHKNAFISTFQKLGYMEDNKLIILSPGKLVQTYDLLDNGFIKEASEDQKLIDRAIDYYQSAYYFYQKGLLKNDIK